MSTLNWIDWTIFCGYLVIVFALGLLFAGRQRSNEDYFVGGRRMNWLAVGISLFATAFSAVSFVALPREAAYQDYHFFVTLLCIPLVITPILWWLFLPLFLRLRITSVYEYLEIRFNRWLRRLGTLLFAGYALGWMGSMLHTVGIILQAVMGLSDTQLVWTLVGLGAFAVAYTTLGGVQAVIWTDVLQAVTLGGGMLVVLFIAVGHVDGGWSGVVELGMKHDKFHMFNLQFDLTKRDTLYAACAMALFMYLPGYTTSQVTVQRYLCVSSLAEARRSLLINAVVATAVALLFFFVGTTLFAFYHQAGGFPEVAEKGQAVLEGQLRSEDQLLPHFVATELPHIGLTGLLLAGMFAAVMSTVDSGINSLTAVVVYDWSSGRNLPVAVSRLLSAFFGVCVVAAALAVPYLGKNVIEMIMKIAGTFLGLLLGAFLLGMFVRRANAAGALIGLITGAVCLTIVWTQTNVPHWWYGAFTCFPTFIVGALASHLFAPPKPEQLRGLVFENNME